VLTAIGAVVGSVAQLAFGELEPLTIGGFVLSLISQIAAAALSVIFSVMLARIYLQLAGEGQAEPSVPTSAA
jgi:mannose/fructose/N-acetylgalactosamine-specific phosphotransferase system component IIC